MGALVSPLVGAMGGHFDVDDVCLDASGARISGSGNRVWGLGLTFEFGR